MSAGLDAIPGRRAVRWVAPVGLCAGGVCLLVGAAVYLGAARDMLPREWTVAPAEVKNLALAGVAVLGTILASVGAVFALLERAGVLAAPVGLRHDRREPELWRGAAAPASSDPAEVPAASPEHEARPTGTGDAEPGASRFRRAAPNDGPDVPAGGAPDPGALGAASIRHGLGLSPTGATEPASEDAAEPEHEREPPEPGGRATETAAPPRAGEGPPAAAQPGDLIAAWDDYRRDGDGHFNRRGMQAVLDQRRLAARVRDGGKVGAGTAVLLVETPSGRSHFYVLPSFNKSPRAVADWFHDSSGGALTGRTQRVTRMAEGRWVKAEAEAVSRRFEVIEKGEVA